MQDILKEFFEDEAVLAYVRACREIQAKTNLICDERVGLVQQAEAKAEIVVLKILKNKLEDIVKCLEIRKANPFTGRE